MVKVCAVLFAMFLAAGAGSAAEEEGFFSLFDGKTLNGWKLIGGHGPGYVPQDGKIVCPADGGGNLFTEKEYANFVFRFKFLLTPAANNGIGIRAPYEGDAAYKGMEIQILDDSDPVYRGKIRPEQYHGSVYDVIPARTGYRKPLGEWNEEEITARGRRITVKLNGTDHRGRDFIHRSGGGSIRSREQLISDRIHYRGCNREMDGPVCPTGGTGRYTSSEMRTYSASQAIMAENRRHIPGGMYSLNRQTDPEIVFVRGEGALLWDADDNRYIDYHAAFGPYLLGHNHPEINAAVERALHDGSSLFGVNTTRLEGRLAELICQSVPFADSVCILNTGSEATYQAIRVARAVTSRDHIIAMQGGYNGWHNDVACNVMTPLSEVGPRLHPGEYPVIPLGDGIPEAHRALVHPVNFNDLESVEYVCRRYPIAALITEPVLQNIGIVKPKAGYLDGLRRLADQYGFVLIFDEVKTGFRHALGGYASLAGVNPDLAVYGKAIANGYPIAALAGRREIMNRFADPDPKRRVFLAGTYNGHPLPVSAAIATVECLRAGNGEIYRRLEVLGQKFEAGFSAFEDIADVPLTLVRQGSAFCIYFMDHPPVDWHDIAAHHDFAADVAMRKTLLQEGVLFFPLATKQCSISAAHTDEMIATTLARVSHAIHQPVRL